MNTKPTYEELEKRVAKLNRQLEQYEAEEFQYPSEILPVLMDAFRYIPIGKSFEDTARVIFEQWRQLTDARSGYVALLSENGEENDVLFSDTGGLPCDVEPSLLMQIRGLCEIAYRTKDVAYDNAFPESPWMQYMPEGHVRLENVLFAPLNIQEKIVGIIGIANKPSGFHERDVHIVKSLSKLAAVALTYAKSQDSLRKSEERFRLLVESSPVSIIMLRDGKYIYGNLASAELLGFDSPDEIIGLKALQTIAPEYHATLQERMERVQAGQINEPIELKIVKTNGETAWTKSTSVSVNIDDEPTAVIFGQDITENKIAEEALLESEGRYRALVMQSTDCLILHDLEGRILDVNLCSCQTYGYSRDELLSMKVSDLDPDYDERAGHGEFYDQMVPGAATVFEARQRSKNGREFPVEVSLSVIDFQGETLIQGLCRDISERKQAENALLARQTFLNTLIDAIPMPVFYKDKKGRYLGFNKAFESFFGTRKESLIGKSVFDFNPSELAVTYHDKDQELLATGGVQIYESQVKDLNGELHDVIFHKAVFTDSQEATEGLIGAILDITESKRAVAEKLKLETRLQQAQKMEAIGTLAGGIAHDFNNILSPVVGFTEMLKEDIPADSPLQSYVDEIFQASFRAKDLVKQILAFSRQGEQEIRPIKLQPIIKEALKLLRSSIPTTIELQQEIDPSCGVVVADPTQIHQIIMNLATNAFQAIEETGGKIIVSLEPIRLDPDQILLPNLTPGNYTRLRVADTGTGIEKNTLSKIFDPYFTTKGTDKGTGLGLAIVQGIVKQCQGDIKVLSEPGQGTEVQIYLPIIDQNGVEQRLDSDQPVEGGTEKILLVDDEQAIVRMEQQMLKRLGYRITARTSSLEALEAFKTNPEVFDLVLTDMTMPNLNGVQLAAELKKIRQDIPIVLCTGFSYQINKEKSKALGIDGFVMKPVIVEEIAATIRNVLEKKKD